MKLKTKFSRLLYFVKSNKITFYLWYRLYRKTRGVKINWFNKDTVFLIDGYPRSGNTFIQMLIKNVFGGIETVHLLHGVEDPLLAGIDLPVAVGVDAKTVIVPRHAHNDKHGGAR